jgi:hypothetical protein
MHVDIPSYYLPCYEKHAAPLSTCLLIVGAKLKKYRNIEQFPMRCSVEYYDRILRHLKPEFILGLDYIET